MSFLKKTIPYSVRSLYNKVNWFKNHFTEINKFSELKSTHYNGPVTYDTDGLTTSNNCDFISEPRFAKAYKAAAGTKPWLGFTLQWRVYVVCWLADYVKNLGGDYVECGVNTGAYSRAIVDYINFNSLGKRFYLLDTFEGFPEWQISEAEYAAGIAMYGGDHYKDVYRRVVETFAGFPVEIIKGIVPDILVKCYSDSIAFLSIDMNAVAPEIAAAEFFWPKLVSGGVMVLDDYGFPRHINQKLAFDNFATQKGVNILCLPTGQGVLFKE